MRAINRHPSRTLRLGLALLPFVALLFAYVIGSSIRLAENPNDKLLPSFAAMGEAMYHYALQPDPQTARAIDAFAARESPEGRRLPLAHQHVTLAITPDYQDYPDALVERLRRAGEETSAEPFDLTLNRLSASRRTVGWAKRSSTFSSTPRRRASATRRRLRIESPPRAK